jgi:RTA1 like protein
MNYVMFTRLLRSTLDLDSVTVGRKLSPLLPRVIMTMFIGSDILSFVIQAIGAGIASANNNSTVNVGVNILLAGTSFNFVSFTLFLFVVNYFDRATRKAYKERGVRCQFLPLIRAMYFSWTFIMVGAS